MIHRIDQHEQSIQMQGIAVAYELGVLVCEVDLGGPGHGGEVDVGSK